MRASCAVPVLELLGLRAVAADPDAHVGRQVGQRGQQHLEALAGLVAPEEEDRRAVGGVGGPLGEALHLDRVEQELVGAAEPALGEGHRVGRHGAAVVEAAGHPLQPPAQVAVGSALPRRVERADLRGIAHQQRGDAGPGRHRLVEVEHLEVLVAQRADGAQLGGRVGGERGDGAVGGGRARCGRAGVTPASGGGPVAGPEHAHHPSRAGGQAETVAAAGR